VHGGKSLATAAVRELAEETGAGAPALAGVEPWEG